MQNLYCICEIKKLAYRNLTCSTYKWGWNYMSQQPGQALESGVPSACSTRDRFCGTLLPSVFPSSHPSILLPPLFPSSLPACSVPLPYLVLCTAVIFLPLPAHSVPPHCPGCAPQFLCLSVCLSPFPPIPTTTPSHCFVLSASSCSLGWGVASAPVLPPEGFSSLRTYSLALLLWLILHGMGPFCRSRSTNAMQGEKAEAALEWGGGQESRCPVRASAHCHHTGGQVWQIYR